MVVGSNPATPTKSEVLKAAAGARRPLFFCARGRREHLRAEAVVIRRRKAPRSRVAASELP